MFISILYTFRALRAHHQENLLYQCDIWYLSFCVDDHLLCGVGSIFAHESNVNQAWKFEMLTMLLQRLQIALSAAITWYSDKITPWIFITHFPSGRQEMYFCTYRLKTDVNRYVSVYVENCPLFEAHLSYKTFWDQALISSSSVSQNQCGRSGER
jgi:hypothetical protein